MSKQSSAIGNFLNVDVELTSRRRLKSLADALKKWVSYDGRMGSRWLLTIETPSIFGKSTPDRVIATLCKLIANLSPAGKRDWQAAQSRVFDIGFESAPTEKTQTVVVRSSVSEKSLKSIAALGASLDITCYRHFDEDPRRVKK